MNFLLWAILHAGPAYYALAQYMYLKLLNPITIFPFLSTMDPVAHEQDPPIKVLHICADCHSRMGVLRVHEGSNKPHCRGKITQSVRDTCFIETSDALT